MARTRIVRCKVCRCQVGIDHRAPMRIGDMTIDAIRHEWGADYGGMYDYEGPVCRAHLGAFPPHLLIYSIAADGTHVAGPGRSYG